MIKCRWICSPKYILKNRNLLICKRENDFIGQILGSYDYQVQIHADLKLTQRIFRKCRCEMISLTNKMELSRAIATEFTEARTIVLCCNRSRNGNRCKILVKFIVWMNSKKQQGRKSSPDKHHHVDKSGQKQTGWWRSISTMSYPGREKIQYVNSKQYGCWELWTEASRQIIKEK